MHVSGFIALRGGGVEASPPCARLRAGPLLTLVPSAFSPSHLWGLIDILQVPISILPGHPCSL